VPRRLPGWLAPLFRRPRRLLLTLAVLAGVALAAPYLWAWYHWLAAGSALRHYHYADARAHLAVCLQAWPGSPEVHLLACRAARGVEDFVGAEEEIRRCQDIQKKSTPETLLEWSLVRAAGGALKDVENYLTEQADKDPAAAPLIWEALVLGYSRMSRVLDGMNCVDRWLKQQPDNPQALYLRGNLMRQVQAVQKAIPDYQRAVELDPGHEPARRALAASLLEVGRYPEALAQLEHLRQKAPDDLDLMVRTARCLKGLGRGREARQTLDVVLARAPDNGAALRSRGQMALLDGQPEEAERWLERAARVLPNDYTTQYALYQALSQQEEKAEQFGLAALFGGVMVGQALSQQWEKSEQAKAQQAVAQSLKDRLERLSEIRTRLMSQRPHDPALHCELGTLLLSLGQKEEGERWLLSAVHEKENYKPAHAALADYYKQQGDEEKAAYHSEQAQSTTPGEPTSPLDVP
jgi:tetratricopeptide (TPR) repeat protein